MTETKINTATEIIESPSTKSGESTRPNRTDVVIGGILDTQEKPWNYEQLGREQVAGEYHEANLDLTMSLVDRIAGAVDASGVFESGTTRATRVELPQSPDGSTDQSYRYEVSTVVSNQDRLSTTITVINGRPELTFYSEPVNTAAVTPNAQPSRYESASWTPEDTAIDYVEQSLNEKLSTMDTILAKEAKEKASIAGGKKRPFGMFAIRGSKL